MGTSSTGVAFAGSMTNHDFQLRTQNSTRLILQNSTGNCGIGTVAPGARIESLATTEQLRLSYDATHYASFTVGATGSLTVGGTTGSLSASTLISSAVVQSGSYFYNSNASASNKYIINTPGPTFMGFSGTGINANANSVFNLGYTAAVGTLMTPVLSVVDNGRVGLGQGTPTATLHIKAGSATAGTAPIKLTSGALNTTAEAGAIEFLTDAYYGTITTGAARKQFAFTSDLTSFFAADANGLANIPNNIGYTAITATTGATTTLTVASKQQQIFTGTQVQTIVMPVATTLTAGQEWIIDNNSTQALTVNTSGGNTLLSVAPKGYAIITCVNIAGGTGVASWDYDYAGWSTATGKIGTLNNSLIFSGTDGSTLNVGTGGTLGTAAYTASTAYATSTQGTTADNALQKAGGTMTGKTVSAGRSEVAKTYTPASGAQTVAIDCSVNNMHVVTGNASGTAMTFTVTGATDSQPFIISILQGAVVSTIAGWFATVRWPGGTTPVLTATVGKRDTFGFIRTGANTYDGFVIGQNC